MAIHRLVAGCLLSFLLIVPWAFSQTPKVSPVKDESWMTYKIVHPLHEFEATSREVNYKLSLDSASRTITSVSGQVDVMSFDSKNSNRDSHAMEVIDAITYPDASFASTHVSQQGDTVTVTGNLTLHGVTKDIVSTGTGKWSDGKLVVLQNFNISMTSYGIDRPSLLMIPVQDTIRFTLQATFRMN